MREKWHLHLCLITHILCIMVSFKSAQSLASSAAAAATMKRKRGVDDEEEDGGGIELGVDATPLPLEWQRCLDIKLSLKRWQSGKIHYYNTRTHKRTWTRPRGDHQHQHRGLDLELNLSCHPRLGAAGERQTPSAPEEAEAPPAARAEMVAAVCMRCHTLVMMCRASPACPNCKFLHPMGFSKSAGTGEARTLRLSGDTTC